MVTYLLHGPPGTGKTYTLSTTWIPRAVELYGVDRVVVCSLTRTAALEIAGRNPGIPRDHIGTLHALAYRQLGRPEIAEAHVKDWNESRPMWALSGGFDVDDPEYTRALEADRTMAWAQLYRHRMVPEKNWPEDVLAFHLEWKKWKDEGGLLDFTDLIEHALFSINCAPGNPGMLIMDEAQDASLLELKLLYRWTHNKADLVLGGDADQAIYEWRGAHATNFLDPPGGVFAEHQRELLQSFRVPLAVWDVAIPWIEQVASRRDVKWQPRNGDDGELEHRNDLSFEYPDIASEIASESDAGRTVMVLASCGYMLDNLVYNLKDLGVLIHNPYKVKRGDWNPMRGGIDRTLAFLKIHADAYGEEARPWTWKELWKWVEHCQARGLLKHGQKAEIQRNAKNDHRSAQVIDRGWFEEIFEHEAIRELHGVLSVDAATTVTWLHSRVNPQHRSKYQYAMAVVDNRGAKELFKKPRVIIGTIHSVKGGEADVCYLAPDISNAAQIEWDAGNSDGIIRQFYVGMTRAKKKLVLCGTSDWRHVQW